MNHIASLFSRERFAYAAAFLFPLALVLTTHAQSPGDNLRLRLSSGSSVEGKLLELKADTLTVVAGLDLMPIPVDQIVGAEYFAGQTTRRRQGAFVGLGLGTVVSIGALCADGCPVQGFDNIAIFLGVVGLVSLPMVGLGVLVGSLTKKDRWEAITLTRPPSQAGLIGPGSGLGVRLTL